MSRYHYIKLKQGLAVEGIETFTTLDSAELIQVDNLPDNFLYKKYINGTWETAQLFKVAVLNENNVVENIYETYFFDDIPFGHEVVSDEVQIGWTFTNQNWVEVTDGDA